jgi:zinc protease
MKYLNKFYLLILIAFIGCQSSEQNVTPNHTEFSLEYEKFTLDNGLEVVLHEDHSDPIVAVATLMHVGSNREKPGRTGFAHFFEHMSFNDSENVPVGANRKLIPEWGGSRNGGTWNDGTIYYEVVPKDAFEKILWIDSDRFGYMINTVTKEALEREKQVVKNEKRERVDNAPYGFTNEVIIKNLYPEGHPYSWTVIGELPDLQAATLDDVKEFYEQYYGASNATLVIAGDIDIKKTKELVQQWFGEIRKGPQVEPLESMPVTLIETKSLYFEDNFAKLPELRMVFPTVEQYHPDEYALKILGELLSNSKKAPLYKVVVEEKKLAPLASSGQSSKEIAGEFVIRIRGNAGVDLDSVKMAVEDGLALFENEGFDDNELLRIKAELETGLYQGIETVLDKAFTLVSDNEFIGDPGYIIKTTAYTNAVTREDIMRVYKKYIKGKHYVMTSFVPKEQLELVVDGAEKALVYEEEIVADVSNEEVGQGAEAIYEKTVSSYDRSEPDFGETPFFTMPEIWTAKLKNTGMEVYGIENNEIPLVTFDITINGGHWLDPIDKSGISGLLSDLMMEGTVHKTSAELEEAIGLLGASIKISGTNEEIVVNATCLSKNFEATVKLVEEMLLEPRWDEVEYDRLKQALETKLKGNEANPTAIGYSNLTKLLYGDEHIMGISSYGSLETVKNITLDDLKDYYANNLSSSLASVHIAGSIDNKRVVNAFESLDKNWKVREVTKTAYELPEYSIAGNLYFIDVPNAKQSAIFLGRLALSASDPDYNNLDFANEILGGGSSGKLFQILRIEKGYTYGAYSFLQDNSEVSPFVAYSSVRANATKPSMEIIIDLLKNYGLNFSEADVETTKNKILKGNTLAYESLSAKRGILHKISKYGKSMKYLEEDQNELVNMTLEDFQAVIEKQLAEDQMIYIVVGDKATQLAEVNQLGRGQAIELDIHGKALNAGQ